MKLLSIILLMGLGSTCVSHAYEGNSEYFLNMRRIPLVTIQAEAYPGVDYQMGFNLDEQGKKEGIFYRDPSLAAQDQYKDYSLSDLQTSPRTMVTASALGRVFNVIQIAYSNNTITILYQPNVLKGRFQSKKFTVDCSHGDAQCIAHDGDNGKATNLIYMYKNTSWGKMVGVSAIESR